LLPKDDTYTVRPREKTVLFLIIAGHGLVHIFDGMIAPLIPILVQHFDTNYFRVGIIVSLFSVLFGLGALPSGFLADRVGPLRLISVYLFGAGAAFMSVLFVDSYWGYAVVMTAAGLFCSTYHPAANTLIGTEITVRGSAFGIHGVSGSIGTALAPAVVAGIASVAGWKMPHLLFGLAAVVVGIFSLRIPLRETPLAKRVDAPVQSLPPAADTDASVDGVHRPPVIPAVSLVLFYVTATVTGLAYRANMTFLPAFMGERIAIRGVDVVTAGGLLATVTLMAGAVGQYIGGRLVDRYRPEGLYLISIVGSLVFLTVMILGKSVVLILAAVVFALFYFMVQPVQADILVRYIPRHRLGASYGLHFMLIFGAGSFGGAGGGFIADRFGLTAVFVASAVVYVLSAVLIGVIFLNRPRRAPSAR